MITIMGAAGKTGGVAANALLDAGQGVRVIGRKREALKPFIDRGAEAAVGDVTDASFLAGAFRGSSAVYALIPPDVASADYSAQQDRVGDAITKAVRDSGATHVVFLSSLGAEHASGTGPIAGLHRQEKRFERLAGLNVLSLRPGFFYENHLMSLALIKHQGINGSAIRGDVALAMIASVDIGQAAAKALKACTFKGCTVQELLGPRDVTLDEATRIISGAIARPDLSYMQFPYEAALDGMVNAGLSKSMASLYVEMSKAFNEGRIRTLEGRNARNTTPTRFEAFAKSVLAPAYRSV